MSPDRRELYLSHKTGVRHVVELDEETTQSISRDARFPLDLLCVHNEIEPGRIAFISYSSKMFSVAKLQEKTDKAGIAIEVIKQINATTKSHRLPEDILQRLPRRTGMRTQEGYDRIPISNEGNLLVTEEYYPILPNSQKTTQSLNTNRWYVWFSIMAEYSNNRTVIIEHQSKRFFVLYNSYNILGEQLM